MTQSSRSPLAEVHMKLSGFSVAAAVLFAPSAVIADDLISSTENGGECPVTLGTDNLLEPDSRNLYGSEALAVALPSDGTWAVTGPSARIAVKLFWRSAGFKPGMQQNGTDKLTRKLGQTLPNITPVACYVAESTHPNTTLSLSVAPNTHFSMRKKLTCQYPNLASLNLQREKISPRHPERSAPSKLA